jgi:L-ascorbate metabolism protein UlaG (beta-lactamase superfamily)
MDSLTYIGHATTLLRLGHGSILTDPMLRNWLGPLQRQGPPPSRELPQIADAVLISHLHRDHLDLPSLRRFPRETPVVVPRGAARWVKMDHADRIREMSPGETISVGEIEVTAVRAEHDGHRGRWGAEIEPLGYVISGGGRTVYFAGDTDLFAEMSELPPLDLALLPVWGWGTSIGEGHLDPARAVEALQMVQPRMAIPIHWGTFLPIGTPRRKRWWLHEPPREFARLAAEAVPEVTVRVLEPGESTSLP